MIFGILYYCIAGSTLAAWLTALMGKRQLGLWLGWAVFIANLVTWLTISFAARRPPIYGHFALIVQMGVILSIFALINSNARRSGKDVPGITIGIWSVSLLLLGVLFFSSKSLNADFHMYNRLSVLSFFNFRINAAAFFLLGAVYICTDIFGAARSNSAVGPFDKGRRFLLIGTICFLISECTGSYWCLNWYGDSWTWSRNFLEASCVFMGVMLAFHIPADWKLPRSLRAVMGCVPAMGTLWLLLI
jgi:hypothetical protein